MASIYERFENKYTIVEDGCWLWLGHVSIKGYGRFRVGKSTPMAHRAAYELYVGKIPDGMVIDHLCRERSCVNPYHLEPVLPEENTRRGNLTHRICEHGVGYTKCNDGCAVEYRRESSRKHRMKIRKDMLDSNDTEEND